MCARGEEIDEGGSGGDIDDGVGDGRKVIRDRLMINGEAAGEAACEDKMSIATLRIKIGMQLQAILKNREK